MSLNVNWSLLIGTVYTSQTLSNTISLMYTLVFVRGGERIQCFDFEFSLAPCPPSPHPLHCSPPRIPPLHANIQDQHHHHRIMSYGQNVHSF